MKHTEIANKAKRYIIDAINASGYHKELQTDVEKIKFLRDTFVGEYGWAVKRYGVQGAIKEWLQGLPSCIDIAFTNYDILELAREWGSLPEDATEKQENKILNNYWDYMANKINVLFNTLGGAK